MTDGVHRSSAEIQTWLVSRLGQLLNLDTETIDVKAPLSQFGLDSSAAVGMTGELEDWLGIEIDPTLFAEYPSIAEAADHLADLGETTI